MVDKKGFTLIEVVLFLAITGVLFFMVTIGVQTSVSQQRYNDSVENFAEFLRGVYGGVNNVQLFNNSGVSDKAVYGKLVTFGETNGLPGTEGNGGTRILVYNVVGSADASYSMSSTTKEALAGLDASIYDTEGNFAGIVESYTPKWEAKVEIAGASNGQGAILIARHPRSGMVYTYVMVGDTVEVNGGEEINAETWSAFEERKIDMCVVPWGEGQGGDRADVRINTGARGASGVEVIYGTDECNG